MSWFKHHHWWIDTTGLIRIRPPGDELPQGGMRVQECRCGAVRTIEFRSGEAPAVRITLPSPHASDCAIHNAPAYPPGECTCGAGKKGEA